jgi:hypothetical protein
MFLVSASKHCKSLESSAMGILYLDLQKFHASLRRGFVKEFVIVVDVFTSS